jgi:predicted DNA-binding protein
MHCQLHSRSEGEKSGSRWEGVSLEKNTVYSMRLSRKLREALNKAAQKECRTVASLVNKVIADYLEKEGYLLKSEVEAERRRFPREKINLPVTTFLDGELKGEAFPGVLLDASMGGFLLTYAKGTEIRFTSKGGLPYFKVGLCLPKTEKPLNLDCVARHMRDIGREIQVGTSFDHPSRSDLQQLNSYLNGRIHDGKGAIRSQCR